MEHELDQLLGSPLEPIRTARLVLRPPRPEDAPAIAALADDPGVAEMLAHVPHPYSLADAEDFLAIAGAGIVFAATLGQGDAFIGVCGLRPTARRAVADLGYWLGRPFWGHGYATEAAHAMVDLAFRLDGLASVVANCRAVNGRSRRVLEKCGFQFRGTGTFVSRAAGRVSSENFALERRTWTALRRWGREGAEA